MSAQSAEQHEHSPKHYVKLYFILLILLIISVIGPEFGIQILTLITAFGIAVVKAYMVAAYFMHLNIERRYIWYMLGSMIIFLFVFFAGTSPDVMELEGRNWINTSAKSIIERHHQEASEEEPH